MIKKYSFLDDLKIPKFNKKTRTCLGNLSSWCKKVVTGDSSNRLCSNCKNFISNREKSVR